MKYLLDTNACIRYINGRAPQIRNRMAQIPIEDISVSTITKAEMFYGSAKSQTPEKSLARQLEFLNSLISENLCLLPDGFHGKICGSDLLRDATSLALLHVGLANLIKYLCLASVDVAKDTANRRAKIVL